MPDHDQHPHPDEIPSAGTSTPRPRALAEIMADRPAEERDAIRRRTAEILAELDRAR